MRATEESLSNFTVTEASTKRRWYERVPCRRFFIDAVTFMSGSRASNELMHEKTYVADDLVLREGSANWSVSAARYQDNQLSITRDTASIEAFKDDFAGMWQRGDNSMIQ